ncbi:hypothetical protein ACFL0L_04155 [Patescibacteria group bacterium]
MKMSNRISTAVMVAILATAGFVNVSVAQTATPTETLIISTNDTLTVELTLDQVTKLEAEGTPESLEFADSVLVAIERHKATAARISKAKAKLEAEIETELKNLHRKWTSEVGPLEIDEVWNWANADSLNGDTTLMKQYWLCGRYNLDSTAINTGETVLERTTALKNMYDGKMNFRAEVGTEFLRVLAANGITIADLKRVINGDFVTQTQFRAMGVQVDKNTRELKVQDSRIGELEVSFDELEAAVAEIGITAKVAFEQGKFAKRNGTQKHADEFEEALAKALADNDN